MKIGLDNKFYIRPGIKIFRENDNLIHFSSCYNCDQYWLQNKKEIIDIIENLDKKDSLKMVINKLCLPASIVGNNDFINSFTFLLEKEIIGEKPLQSILSEAEIEYYYYNIFHLNFIFKKNGLKLQEQLKEKKISLIGLGGSGISLLLSLIGIGIGNIKLIDNDVVVASNIPRQMLYKYSDVGKKKVYLIKEFINKTNPFINIEAYDLYFDEKNKETMKCIIKDCDLLIVAADEPDLMIVLNRLQDICFELNLPFMGTCAADGFIPPLVIPYKSACIRCLLTIIPERKRVKNFPDNIKQLKLEKLLTSSLSVPYYKLLEGNALVAKELINFLLFKKSNLINNFYPNSSVVKKNIPRVKNCICLKDVKR